MLHCANYVRYGAWGKCDQGKCVGYGVWDTASCVPLPAARRIAQTIQLAPPWWIITTGCTHAGWPRRSERKGASWLTSQGGERLRGLASTRDVLAGDILVSIPLYCTLIAEEVWPAPSNASLDPPPLPER